MIKMLLCAALLSWLSQTTPAARAIPSFPQSTVLSSDDIREAIRRGQDGEVAPFLVHRVIGGGPDPKVAVYTPFVRVALAAKAGLLTFDGSQILSRVAKEWIASPEVLVVIGNPCPGTPDGCEAGDVVVPITTTPRRVYISPSPSSPSATPASPVRVLAVSDLQWLGIIPVAAPVVAATFNPQEFKAGSRIAAEWGRYDRIIFPAGGHFQSAEMETWR